MQRKRIVFTAPKQAELIKEETPMLLQDECLVKMEYTVVSGGTERACIMSSKNTSQHFPMSLGYCGVGRVEKIGAEIKNFAVGDRVLVYHGFHASYNCAKEEKLTKVEDENISSLEAAFVVIAAMGLGGARKLEIELGESAMVMGQGLLGLFATQFLRLSGANPVIVADLNPQRRSLALSLGADYAFDPSEPDFVEKVKAVTKGKGVNGCVEVTGVSVAMKQALECASWQGRISLLGCTRVSNCAVDYYQQVHRPGVKLIGAHNFVRPKFESYPHHWTHQDDCKAILDLISAKRLQVLPIVSRVEKPETANRVYTELCEDKNFPVGTVFDWREEQ
ncbi:MAG: zinc-binding alcohol dehydrogenase [Clostridia bacterium]|nr:zinc-binding alcohol dehydrogenase [Clostridia bacterium]